MSVDNTHFPGMVAVVTSLLAHTTAPERVVFHVVLPGQPDRVALEQYMDCFEHLPREKVGRGRTLPSVFVVCQDHSDAGWLAWVSSFPGSPQSNAVVLVMRP